MYHANKTEKFYVLLTLFLFGALKIYLNERPFEPRAIMLSGIFLCLCHMDRFWVYALYESAKIAPKVAGPIIIAASILYAPVLMASQN
jgi:hypothetical protein